MKIRIVRQKLNWNLMRLNRNSKAAANLSMATKTKFLVKGIKDNLFKKYMKIALSYLFYYSGIIWIHEEFFSKNCVRILAYHSISKVKHHKLEIEQEPEIFRQQLEFLKKNYSIISLSQFLMFRKNGNYLPPKAVMITFDDGYGDNFLNAYPILQNLGAPATIFCAPQFINNREVFYFDIIRHAIYKKIGEVTDLRDFGLGLTYMWKNDLYLSSVINILTTSLKEMPPNIRDETVTGICHRLDYDPRELLGKKFYLTWQDLKEMSENGVEFGSHSFSHAHLASIPATDLREELLSSKRIIEEKLGKQIKALAYPFGSTDSYDDEVVRQAQRVGYEVGFSLNGASCDLAAFTVSRKMIDSNAVTGISKRFCKPLFASELALRCPNVLRRIAPLRKAQDRINILYIIDVFRAGGGTERHLTYLCTELDRKRFSPHLVVFDFEYNDLIREIYDCGIPVYHIHVGREYSPRAFKKALHLAKIIRGNRIDIVQTFHFKSDTYGALISYLAGAKRIISSKRDTGDLKKKRHFIFHRLCNHFIRNFIFVSDSIKKTVSEKEHLANKRMKTIFNGIDPSRFMPPDMATRLANRRKYYIPTNAFVIGMVAWLRPEKNHPVLFEAIRLVKNTIPDSKVLIVGGGPLLDTYQILTKEMGLEEQMIFTGPCEVQAIHELLATVDLACLVPVSNEGFSNSVLEKMAMGLPLIVSNVGGNAEAVLHGDNGLVIPANDSTVLADAIVSLYQDKDRLKEMGRRSRQRVEEKFSMARMIQAHEQFYEEIMRKS